MSLATLGSPIDTTAIDSLANELGREADLIRTRAHALLAAAHGAHWQSSGAMAYQRKVDVLATQFLQAANRLDEAAFTTRAHAAAVRASE